jgi:hypothetical protein
MQPVAQASFRRNERLRVQWPLAGSTVQPSAQILDRRGQPLGAPLPVTESTIGGERVVVFDLMLASLAPADYIIQLTAGDDNPTERYLVPFRIAR